MLETHLLVNSELRKELAFEGLLDLETLASRDDFEVVKARLESRQTYRTKTTAGRVLYVKLYREVAPEPLLGGLFARRFASPAAREWHVLKRLDELGIPTMTPAACIEEAEHDHVVRAALITVGLNAPQSLQEVVREELSARRRQHLARELGRILKFMHAGGVNHRDFYFVHIRVGEGDKLYVTDLNRADIRNRVTRRWRVKDVAALAHSAPSTVTNTDRARFIRAYLGGRLSEHRAFIEAVLRKSARMTAHTRKRVAKGGANYHVVE